MELVEFWPIFMGSSYKLVAKVLVARLANVNGNLISPK